MQTHRVKETTLNTSSSRSLRVPKKAELNSTRLAPVLASSKRLMSSSFCTILIAVLVRMKDLPRTKVVGTKNTHVEAVRIRTTVNNEQKYDYAVGLTGVL